MNSPDGSPLRSSRASDSSQILPRVRSPEKTAAGRPISDLNLSFRRSNASLSALFAASTAGFPKRASSPIVGKPPTSVEQDAVFAPSSQAPESADAYRETILRSFVPHIAVLSSADTEELLAQKGLNGGLLELLRPYGENIQGQVTIRDSSGSSKSWQDYAVRFTKLKDGQESPREQDATTQEAGASKNIDGYMDHMFPQYSARLRTGGDVEFVEQTMQKHIQYAEVPTRPNASSASNPFHLLYLRRLLSGLPMSTHETFSHPVACVVAISSRNADPIEELRSLYATTTNGNLKMPPFVNNDYLRYYVLVHDEEHDDVQRSTLLFEQMKRHFGLHCHLLRIRSTQCVQSDDDALRLPVCEWLSAAEELSEIERRENLDDMEDAGPCLYESDAAAVKSLVRELVTQSVIPMLERQSATWNDQIVSRRKGFSGRFLSLSKKWTPFGSSSSRSSSPSGPPSGASYDSLNGIYRPDTETALLRRLGDSCVMLRDFKLAHTAYDLLRNDCANDKAWKHYAGACEMTAITALLGGEPLSPSKSRSSDNSSMEALLEATLYQYVTRCNAPFYALRALAVAVELLHSRGAPAADEAARWTSKILESQLVGAVGTVLFSERASSCFAVRSGTGSRHWGARNRKAALWSVVAAQRWLEMGQQMRAAQCLNQAWRLYGNGLGEPKAFKFQEMRMVLEELDSAVTASTRGLGPEDSPGEKQQEIDETTEEIELLAENRSSPTQRRFLQDQAMDRLGESSTPPPPLLKNEAAEGADAVEEKVDIRRHRQSLIGVPTGPATGDPLGVQEEKEQQQQQQEERNEQHGS